MDGARDDQWMANVAAEMNLAETAFLTPGDDGWGLRWFTPAVEVDLCGHATLASAHAIWSENISSDARAALPHAQRRADGETRRRHDRARFPRQARGADRRAGRPSRRPRRRRARRTSAATSSTTSSSCPRKPKCARSSRITACCANCPCAASSSPAAASGEYDFISRFFAPGSGVDEDPGHRLLALLPHALLVRAPRQDGDERATKPRPRGGAVRVRLDGDRVKLAGHAVTVFRGELLA